jgi:hypothetical protein
MLLEIWQLNSLNACSDFAKMNNVFHISLIIYTTTTTTTNNNNNILID